MNLYHYKAVVVSAYDGDTCRCDIDLGFGTWLMNEPVRLQGINAPEIRGGTEASKKAGKKARNWFRGVAVGKPVYLYSHKFLKGKYGRIVATLTLEGEETSLNQQMVDLGLAKVADY